MATRSRDDCPPNPNIRPARLARSQLSTCADKTYAFLTKKIHESRRCWEWRGGRPALVTASGIRGRPCSVQGNIALYACFLRLLYVTRCTRRMLRIQRSSILSSSQRVPVQPACCCLERTSPCPHDLSRPTRTTIPAVLAPEHEQENARRGEPRRAARGPSWLSWSRPSMLA
jgi:hypothetical protein